MSDVAAFDFDGTLTAGGSVYGFLSGLGGPGTVATASAVLLPRLVHAAVAGGRVADRSKELLFQRVLSGVPVERAERFAVGFARGHLESHLRPDVHRRFEWHRRRGDRVVIVSASPELYVAEAGRLLGADGVVATRLEVAGDDTLTGRYRGANCRGDEKLRRLRQWMEESGGGPERLWAYGNSRGDLTMLGAADVGVDVGRLGAFGRLRAFPRLDATLPDPAPG